MNTVISHIHLHSDEQSGTLNFITFECVLHVYFLQAEYLFVVCLFAFAQNSEFNNSTENYSKITKNG